VPSTGLYIDYIITRPYGPPDIGPPIGSFLTLTYEKTG